MPADSVKCTCSGHTWYGTMTKPSADILQMIVPQISATANANTDVVCAAGDVSCKALEWTSGTTAATEITATCWACDSGTQACTAANSRAATADQGVVESVATVTFTFKQDANSTKATDFLKVKDVMYEPNSKNAVGRFYFKPSTTMPLYKYTGSNKGSKISYTFGSQTFGSTAICQVFTSDGTRPSSTPSDLVNKCEASG
jgi:hypothetical protein